MLRCHKIYSNIPGGAGPIRDNRCNVPETNDKGIQQCHSAIFLEYTGSSSGEMKSANGSRVYQSPPEFQMKRLFGSEACVVTVQNLD